MHVTRPMLAKQVQSLTTYHQLMASQGTLIRELALLSLSRWELCRAMSRQADQHVSRISKDQTTGFHNVHPMVYAFHPNDDVDPWRT